MSIGSGIPGLGIEVARVPEAVRRRVEAWRAAGETVALVPTMGALHEGHRTLVRSARAGADRVVVSIFVNPRQFAPTEDFATYPRTENADLEALTEEGADLAWVPAPDVVYPPGFETTVKAGPLGQPMEGAHRPGFFDGVATVVAKLFALVRPHRAYFGEKDFQQLLVVSRMALDLDLGVEVVPVPTVREADGLALSSRNVHLSPEDRAVAPALHRTMARMAARLADGASAPEAEIAWGRERILEAGFAGVDYLDIRDPRTLEPVTRAGVPARILVAARLGTVRLIDNVSVA
ncbi:pantothenate synthetase [Thalassobaculum fulvum]|uniref:Pantothenate synthetase n=1 Tax=Thalassobaculum fulvum TaxID=1633335 RepID=A0A919CNA9_9PROT|nr:pantoate--beta-alanine ligase [Thalassobaculum fulvum]GHD43798.1 pantothenate synthetase [Thalassobaculum fulvum]